MPDSSGKYPMTPLFLVALKENELDDLKETSEDIREDRLGVQNRLKERVDQSYLKPGFPSDEFFPIFYRNMDRANPREKTVLLGNMHAFAVGDKDGLPDLSMFTPEDRVHVTNILRQYRARPTEEDSKAAVF